MKFKVYIKDFYSKSNIEIEIQDNSTLADLADAICNSELNEIVEELNDDSHLYLFTTNLKNAFHINPKFVNYEKDVTFSDESFSFSAFKVLASEVFEIKTKMLFAYDFGTTTYFIVRRII